MTEVKRVSLPGPSLKLEFEYTAEDWQEAANTPRPVNQKPVRPGQRLLGWIVFVGLVVSVIFVFHERQRRRVAAPPARPVSPPLQVDRLPYWARFAVPIVCISALVRLARFTSQRSRRRQAQDPSMHLGRRTMEIAAEGFVLRGSLLESITRWNHNWSFAESKSLMVLFDEHGSQHPIPKRAMQREQFYELREMLRKSFQPPIEAFQVLPAKDAPVASPVIPCVGPTIERQPGTETVAEFRYTAEDLRELTKGSSTRKRAWQAWLKLFGWLMGFILAAAPLFVGRYDGTAAGLIRALAGVVAVEIVVVGILFAVLYACVSLRSRMNPTGLLMSTSLLQQIHEVLIDDGGLTLSTVLAATRWRWEAFVDTIETPQAVLLRLVDGRQVVILPRRGFTSETAIERIKSRVQSAARSQARSQAHVDTPAAPI